MPLPRFRLRTLMIAVAVVGVLVFVGIEAVRLRRLSQLYRQKATQFARAEAGFRADAIEADDDAEQVLGISQSLGKSLSDPELLHASKDMVRVNQELATTAAKQAQYYGRLRRKYEKASRRPWISVPPDPEPPPLSLPVFPDPPTPK